MEKKVAIVTKHHLFAKSNLVTKTDKHGMYDEYTCERCGLKGKRRGLDIFLHVNSTDPRFYKCDGAEFIDEFLHKWAWINYCDMVSSESEHIQPGTVHKIVKPPKGYFNGDGGVWVQGKTQPIKLLFGEYEIEDVEYVRTR